MEEAPLRMGLPEATFRRVPEGELRDRMKHAEERSKELGI